MTIDSLLAVIDNIPKIPQYFVPEYLSRYYHILLAEN